MDGESSAAGGFPIADDWCWFPHAQMSEIMKELLDGLFKFPSVSIIFSIVITLALLILFGEEQEKIFSLVPQPNVQFKIYPLSSITYT